MKSFLLVITVGGNDFALPRAAISMPWSRVERRAACEGGKLFEFRAARGSSVHVQKKPKMVSDVVQ